MPFALGLVETNGLIAAIEAADAMAKASAVKLIGKEKTNPALVTIKVVGEVAAVKASVEAGAAAASRVGIVVSTHIIPRPDLQLADLYPEILTDEENVKFFSQSEIHAEPEIPIVPAIEVLPEIEQEMSPVAEEAVTEDLEIAPEDINPEEEISIESVAESASDGEELNRDEEEQIPELNEAIAEGLIEEQLLEDFDTEEAEMETFILDEEDETEESDDIVFETEEYSYDDSDSYQIDNSDDFEQINEAEDDTTEEFEPFEGVEESVPAPDEDTVLTEEETKEIHETYVEVFSTNVEDEAEIIIDDPEVNSPDDYLFEDLFAQAERIEKEKKAAPKEEKKAEVLPPEVEPVPEVEESIPEDMVYFSDDSWDKLQDTTDEEVIIRTDLEADEVATEETAAEVTEDETEQELVAEPELTTEIVEKSDSAEEEGKPLDTMNVHQLRHLARNTANFPIQGREISKANRQELLYYFNEIR